MELRPGKKGPEKYFQEEAHTAEIYRHNYFKILSRLPALPSPPIYEGSFSFSGFMSSCIFFSLLVPWNPLFLYDLLRLYL